MKYPIQDNELQECYRSYTGEEPKAEVVNWLSTITGAVNQAYIDGVEEGMNRIKGE